MLINPAALLPTSDRCLIFCRYYCSKPCQVSDWPRHKEYHKSLEKSKNEQDGQHALGSLVIHEDADSGTCSVESRDSDGRTALLRAAMDDKWREVRKLILGGADPSVADGQGLTALHYAAILGRTGLARTLLELGPAGLIFCEASGGETCLWAACLHGHRDVMMLLIEAGP